MILNAIARTTTHGCISGHPRAFFLPVCRHRWGDAHALSPVLVTSNSLYKEKAERLT